MIPFGVKILWFVLSLTGLISSWMVLIPFGRAVGAMWGPGLFGLGNTVLQGIFCLGMIWRMDPFLMPKGFCVAQTLIIGFATFLLTGVAGAFSMATSLAVLRPRTWGDNSALKWRNAFLLPVVVFPVVATVAHVVIVVKFDSVKPTDDLHCDSSDPLWARFFSYAGVPFIISLPCMFFSVKSLVIIWKAHQKNQRTNRSLVFESVGNYTSLPPRSLKYGSVSILIKDPEPSAFGYQSALLPATSMSGLTTGAPSFVTANEYPPGSVKTNPSPTPIVLAGQSISPVERKFHLPFRPPRVETPAMGSVMEPSRKQGGQEEEIEEDMSDVLSALPDFGRSESPRTLGKEKQEGYDRQTQSTEGESDFSEVVWAHPRVENDSERDEEKSRLGSRRQVHRTYMRDDESEVLEDVVSGDVVSGRYLTPMEFVSQPSLAEGAGTSRCSPNLAPAIWRIILFQTAFCAVQVLTCISTIIDLATHRPTPTPLGTQHFALLLAAWGPTIVFGHSPAVRKSLKFWGRDGP